MSITHMLVCMSWCDRLTLFGDQQPRIQQFDYQGACIGLFGNNLPLLRAALEQEHG